MSGPGRLARLGSDLRVEASEHIVRSIAVDNVRRIRVICTLALVISAMSITRFALMEPADAAEGTWRAQVLAGHGVLLAAVTVLLLVTTRPRWREPGVPSVPVAAIRGLEWTTIGGLLLAGIYFSTVDQAVTDSITPFVLVCVLAGLLVLVPAARSAPAFAIAAVVFAVVIGGYAAGDAAGGGVGVSNQVNGLSAAVLGLMLAVVRYHSEVRALVQQGEIEQQRADLERANAALAHTAAHDELTGLVNRREANRRIAAEVERLRRSGGSACLLLLDLDHFKQVNDRFGHPAGDHLLQGVAEVLRSRLRGIDLAARWGGEEFLVLLVGTEVSGAMTVAEELRHAVASRVFDLGAAGQGAVTVSIGVTGLDVTLATPMDVAYREVDEALYAAKAAGRDRVLVAVASGVDGTGSAGSTGPPGPARVLAAPPT